MLRDVKFLQYPGIIFWARYGSGCEEYLSDQDRQGAYFVELGFWHAVKRQSSVSNSGLSV